MVELMATERSATDAGLAGRSAGVTGMVFRGDEPMAALVNDGRSSLGLEAEGRGRCEEEREEAIREGDMARPNITTKACQSRRDLNQKK